ncbi:MAG: molybdopterin-dependent oxidoreductase, partial [Candidatus Latescibacteria bacterium]|nr:molybdopterin-dependent oxidoreductase [Candidatus Latescibacterota bacterium]
MPTINIDGEDYVVDDGLNIVQACAQAGIEVPHFCYHPGLKADGNCRMCLTEMEVAPDRWVLVTSCTTPANRDGTKIRTTTPPVLDNRKGIMEFLLINHPLDCPWCDQAGECRLQNYSFDHGRSQSRYVEDKRVPPKKDLGSHITLFSTRCILCQRCTRFCDQVPGTSELGVTKMGSRSEIDIHPDRPLENPMSGNVADICPVGALVTKDFLYKPRIWHYDKVNTVCTGCSTGCNTLLEVMDHKIYRTRPRENMDVNTFWMCDDGRFLYNEWQDLDRFKSPMERVDGELVPISWTEALARVGEHIVSTDSADSSASVALVGSAAMTNEENYLLRRLGDQSLKDAARGLYRRPDGEEWVAKSGFRIEADKSANARGAAEMLGVSDMKQVIDGIQAGTVKTVYFLNGDTHCSLTSEEQETLGKLDLLIVQDVAPSALTALAHIVLPGASPFEKDGTVTNVAGRVQRLRKAFPPPGGAQQDTDVIRQIAQLLDV